MDVLRKLFEAMYVGMKLYNESKEIERMVERGEEVEELVDEVIEDVIRELERLRK